MWNKKKLNYQIKSIKKFIFYNINLFFRIYHLARKSVNLILQLSIKKD